MAASGSLLPDSPPSERNANQRPSSDQRGLVALFRFGIKGCGGSLPSVGTIQMFAVRGVRGSLGSPGSLTTKTTFFPSGESCSSLISRMDRTSLGVNGMRSDPAVIGVDVTGFCAGTVTHRNVVSAVAASAAAVRAVLFSIVISLQVWT